MVATPPAAVAAMPVVDAPHAVAPTVSFHAAANASSGDAMKEDMSKCVCLHRHGKKQCRCADGVLREENDPSQSQPVQVDTKLHSIAPSDTKVAPQDEDEPEQPVASSSAVFGHLSS